MFMIIFLHNNYSQLMYSCTLFTNTAFQEFWLSNSKLLVLTQDRKSMVQRYQNCFQLLDFIVQDILLLIYYRGGSRISRRGRGPVRRRCGPLTRVLFGENVCENKRIGSRRGACARKFCMQIRQCIIDQQYHGLFVVLQLHYQQ